MRHGSRPFAACLTGGVRVAVQKRILVRNNAIDGVLLGTLERAADEQRGERGDGDRAELLRARALRREPRRARPLEGRAPVEHTTR